MKIKEFEALTLKECLHQVRQELGPEAVILETRKFRKGGILGWGARDAVRIVAATGVVVSDPRGGQKKPAPTAAGAPNPAARSASGGGTAVAERRPAASPVEDVINPGGPQARRTAPTPSARSLMMGEAQAPDARASVGAGLAPPAATAPDNGGAFAVARAAETEHDPATQDKLARLEREMAELKEGILAMRQAAVVVAAPAPPAPQCWGENGRAAGGAFVPLVPSVPYPEVFARLRRAEVPEELAGELVRALPDLGSVHPDMRTALLDSALRDLLAGRARAGGPVAVTPGQRKVVAFIGPTGVGKTTTIAKLAANFALIEKRRVGLVTMDTYRIAAVEQLKTYSQIIDIPIEVVYNQSDLGPAIAKFGECDLVLIDTAGRSQKNIMQVSELKTLVETAGCETHLVLAASTKERDLRDQVQRFTGAGVDRLLFTKLDETTTYGTMFSVAVSCGIPVSYVTTGQKVPEDIEAVTGQTLAGLVLREA